MSILPRIIINPDKRKLSIERKLIKFESEIGRNLFGDIPKNHQREFFCLDSKTWIWHEAWKDNNGYNSVMTKYILRPKGGILKSQNSGPYKLLSKEETINLIHTIRKYVDLVSARYQTMIG